MLPLQCSACINRIRLEFKDIANTYANAVCFVLIESDWNLKSIAQMALILHPKVLIESDWNLKFQMICNNTYPMLY